jgi:hypothetical protein
MEVNDQLQDAVAFPPVPIEQELSGPLCRSGCFGDERNNLPLPGIEPLSVQPVAYIDHTIPAPLHLITSQSNKILSSDEV